MKTIEAKEGSTAVRKLTLKRAGSVLVLIGWLLLLAFSQGWVSRATRVHEEEYPAAVLKAALAKVLPATDSDPLADAFTTAGTRFFPILEPSSTLPRMRAVAFRVQFLSEGRVHHLLLGVDSQGLVTGFTLLKRPATKSSFARLRERKKDASFWRGNLRPEVLGDEENRFIHVPSMAATPNGRVLEVIRYGRQYFLKLNREGSEG